MELPFVKYHGAGNDFIIVDNTNGSIQLSNQQIASLCHRRLGIGADGLMIIEKSSDAPFYMRYFNSDGNESTMCGNGGRCISHYASALKIVNEEISFRGIDGMHFAEILTDGRVKLKMKDVEQVSVNKAYTFLDTGSPHHVVFTSHVKEMDVYNEGKRIRHSSLYPNGTNVDFVEVLAPDHLFVRTFERGVEDETLSCGTGVVASAIASFANGTPSVHYHIDTLGGKLEVAFNHQKAKFIEVYLTGPVKFVFEGKVNIK